MTSLTPLDEHMQAISPRCRGLIVLDHDACEKIYGAELVAEIGRRVNLVAPPVEAAWLGAHPEILADVEVIFSGWGAPRFDEAFLAKASSLQVVLFGAGSIRNVVTEAFWRRGIQITSAYAINAIPVAEFTLAAILLSLKQLWAYLPPRQPRGAYPVRRTMAGAYGSTIGLISLGVIGRRVRERLRAYDLKVLAYDPFVGPEQAAQLDVEMVDIHELFARSDVLSVHTPWLPETEGLITGELLASMKPGATFLNTARGAVVREDELIAVMKRRPDLTAFLDVTHPEPPAQDSPLLNLANVLITPHVAGSMDHECRRMGREMLAEFDRWKHGKPMRWALTETQMVRMA